MSFKDEDIKVIMEVEAVKTSNWMGTIRGMRNPLQSYDKFDTNVKMEEFDFYGKVDYREIPILGENDYKLATTLATLGGSHSKYLRQLGIICNITAPLLWWVEFDTYKVGTVANSTSKMFKLGSRELTKNDLALDDWTEDDDIMLKYINKLITKLLTFKGKDKNTEEYKKIWRKLMVVIPSSFIYTRTVTLNYDVLRNMNFYRKSHKLKEWRVFLDKIIEKIPYGNHLIRECNKGKVQE